MTRVAAIFGVVYGYPAAAGRHPRRAENRLTEVCETVDLPRSREVAALERAAEAHRSAEVRRRERRASTPRLLRRSARISYVYIAGPAARLAMSSRVAARPTSYRRVALLERLLHGDDEVSV